MARTEWTKAKLATLRRLGDDNLLHKAPSVFGCTENAAKIKYGRICAYTKAKVKPVKNPVVEGFGILKLNPFKIEQVAYTGLRATPEIIVMLAKQMMNLKANKVDSIAIPLSISKNKRESSNLFQQAKTYISKTIIGENIFTIKTTFSSDQKKTYLGARIWRIK